MVVSSTLRLPNIATRIGAPGFRRTGRRRQSAFRLSGVAQAGLEGVEHEGCQSSATGRFGKSQKVLNSADCGAARSGSDVSSVLCRWFGTVAQDRLADILIVGVAGLDLLRDGVHVAKPPLELVGAEH